MLSVTPDKSQNNKMFDLSGVLKMDSFGTFVKNRRVAEFCGIAFSRNENFDSSKNDTYRIWLEFWPKKRL